MTDSYLADCSIDGHLNRALEVGIGTEGSELGIDGDAGEEIGQDVLDVGSQDALSVGGTRGA